MRKYLLSVAMMGLLLATGLLLAQAGQPFASDSTPTVAPTAASGNAAKADVVPGWQETVDKTKSGISP